MTYNDEFLKKALAYLEVGKLAMASAPESVYYNTGEFDDALAYQMYLAIELFYKHMIMEAEGVAPVGHNLSKLAARYSKNYQDDKYEFVHPFDFSDYSESDLNPGEAELYQRHTEKFSPAIMDQHLRYPVDVTRDRPVGGYSFSLNADHFAKIGEDMLRLSGISQEV